MSKTRVASLLIFICLAYSSNAQVLKKFGNKIKEKAGNTVSKPDDEKVLIKAAIVALKKSYAKKDSTSMNLALSSYDNVSFYSDRKGAENALRYGSTLISEMGDYEFSREDEGKSTAELVGLSNPFGKKNDNQVPNNSYAHLSDAQYQTLKQAETLTQTGELSYSSRLYNYAKTSFIGASELLKTDEVLEKSLLHAKVQSNLGMLSHSVGDFSSSENYFSEALAIMGRSGIQNNYLYAVIANNQAILLKDQGKFNRAEEQLKGVISVFETLGDAGLKAKLTSKNNLAILYQYLGRTEEAIALLEEITSNQDAWGEKSNSFQRVNINLALIYENVGRVNEAESIYLKALALKRKQRKAKQPDYASILTNLSSLYLNNGQLDKDITGMLSQAADIYKKQYGEEHPTLVTVNAIKVEHALSNQNLGEAVSIANQNYSLTGKLFGEDHPRRSRAAIQLAYAEWKNGDHLSAKDHFVVSLDKNIEYINNFFPAMSEVEKGKFWQTLQSDFHTFYAFAFDENSAESLNQVLKYEMATKGLLLSTSGKIRKKIQSSGDQELIKNYHDWKSTKNQLAYYYSVSKEDLVKQKVNLDSLLAVANEKERWLSTRSNIFSSKSGLKPKQLSKSLAANEALIDLIKFYDRSSNAYHYQALIVRNDQISSSRIGSAKELDQRMIKLFKNAIKYKRTESRSYQAFWQPIEGTLSGINKIYVVKDGVFNQVSLGSLHDGSGYLANKYDLSILTSPASFTATKVESFQAKNLFLMGSPAFDESKYTPLPGTLTEVNSIASIANQKKLVTNKFLDKEATEKNFEKATYSDVLHVATHGFFVEKKEESGKSVGDNLISNNVLDALMRSGIVLSNQSAGDLEGDITQVEDGLVTAYEISTLDFPSTELVVLSACETGLGEIKTGEGVYGLQRSFLVAGAQSVIMSLWKVNDDATKDFMIGFYNHWLSTGQKHEAFNKAKRELMQKYKEPYYWGAFVLIEG